jgi:uncharacterized sporulation protein YeaH/YhbH (DUF444 family)
VRNFTIIDRRENPKGKSLSNRQRFLERAKHSIKKAAHKAFDTKSIGNQEDTVINIENDGTDEPRFRTDPSTGDYDYVLPGNEEFIVGDIIRKPKKKAGGGSGGDGSGNGKGEDDFDFVLSYEEFLDVIFDDLELPDLIKKSEKNAVSFSNRRAGHTTTGMPSNLNVEKTAMAGMARRIALKSPKFKKIHELEEELKNCQDENRMAAIKEEIASLRKRANAIGYLDDVDLRYNNFVKTPKPITQAVMILLMDVSGSMGVHEKTIAKKFFVLLHLFLKRRYENIDVVFVRHHDEAMECDEVEFFNSRETGGTIVSKGYQKIKEIIAERYHSDDWNIYIAQASDGDNSSDDNQNVVKYLVKDLLPIAQYFTYLEIDDGLSSPSIWGFAIPKTLWHVISPLTKENDNLTCATINDENKVISVFRNLFNKALKK